MFDTFMCAIGIKVPSMTRQLARSWIILGQSRLLLVLAVLLLTGRAGAQTLSVFPSASVAPRGSYQTVTAIVTGVNNKTVTWTASGGTIVGTNPCVVNEPCTVALYTTTAGKYTLTATSNANGAVTASSTLTFTASPTVTTGHPRLLVTAAMLPALQAKATAGNVTYQALKTNANNSLAQDNAIWSWTTWNGTSCAGPGTGLPSSNQTANWRENDAFNFTTLSLIAPTADERNTWGCHARDIWTYLWSNIVAKDYSLVGNEWSDAAPAFTLSPDWLMGGGYLSSSDINLARQFLAFEGQQSNTVGTYGSGTNGYVPPAGPYNSSAEFNLGGASDLTAMRAISNNYTYSREQYMAAIGLTFDDNTTDDPPLANTCSATRYQMCPDWSAGSLHAYWKYLQGAMLYLDWAALEDPSVAWQAYQSAYSNLPTQPTCTFATNTTYPCFGINRGGESAEGSWYVYSTYRLRYMLNMLHTTGYDDPIVNGPQVSLGTSSWWDLKYLADTEFLTGANANNAYKGFNYLSTGDTNSYVRYPSDFQTESSMMVFDSYSGRTDRTNALLWPMLNTAFGGPTGTANGCTQYCGFDSELVNAFAQNLVLDLFIALPAGDPVASSPSDPRPGYPVDLYNGSANQHQMIRSGWTGNTTFFSYYCANSMVNHEYTRCGTFDLYSNNEYVTKNRVEFNDYDNFMTTATQNNELSIVNAWNGTGQACLSTSSCGYWYMYQTQGGQWPQGMQAGMATLAHSELPSYVSDIVDMTNLYNGDYCCGVNTAPQYNNVTHASRSLVYLRGTNQIAYYDRAVSRSAQQTMITQITTGTPTITNSTGSWLTRSGNQKAYFTSLLPSGASFSDVALMPNNTYPSSAAGQANDWEPSTTIQVNAGATAATQFLSVFEWGSSSLSKSTTSLVQSSSGTTFDGAKIGSSVVMFKRNWTDSVSGITYPASGATNHYIADLIPSTNYPISGDGAPSSAVTDTAGVLTFTSAGTGNITIGAGGPTVTNVNVAPSSVTVSIAGTQQYVATCVYSDGSSATCTSTSNWSSSSPAIAAITSTGIATALAAGTATISATSGGITGTATLTVSAPTLTSIAVTPGTASIVSGTGTQQYLATCSYSNSTTSNCTQTVQWSSSNPAFATVSSSGLAAGVASGNAIISASSGGLSATSTLTVSSPSLVSIAVTPSTVSVQTAGTQQFTASCAYANNTNNNCTSTVSWTSSNLSVATTSANGLVTAIAPGTSTIKAISSATTGSAILTATGPTLTSITVNPSTASIVAGTGTEQYSAKCAYSNGTSSNCTSTATWSSGTPAVATITSGGMAAGLTAGTSTMKATIGSTVGTGVLTVTNATLTRILVAPATVSIAPGTGTQQYKATCIYSDNSQSNCTSTVNWSSSNPAAATIASTGLAAGVAAGTSTIAASSGSTSGNSTLTVANLTLTKIAVTPGFASIVSGSGSQQFTASCRYSDSTSSDCTSTATWKTSNSAVATISSTGTASGITAGPAIITATFGATTGTGLLTVTKPILKSILVTPGTVSIPAGTGTQQFVARCQFSDSTNNDCTSTVTWSSSNQTAVPIATNGVANGRQSGTATITAASGSVTASSLITVLPASALQSVRNGEWAWIDGSSTAAATLSPLVGVRGALGTLDSGNVPAGREESVSWTDSKGNLWLFGGQGFDSAGNDGYLNDLWEYVPSSQKWAWISGSSSIPTSTTGQPGVYGSLGVAEAGNTPGGRVASVSWTDSTGNLWLFGGEGYDSTGVNGKLNDLWRFAPSSQEWVWVGGSNTVPASNQGQTGVYGKLGVPAAATAPGGRWGANSWTDGTGKFWLFGGVGIDSTGSSDDLNDLWVFDPSTNEWTWAGGSSVGGQPGIYGALGSASITNAPGGRSQAISWTDSNGNFWLFGGTGYDSAGYRGYLNDVWEFSNSTNEWTWIGGGNTVGCLNCGQSGIYGTLGAASATNIPGGRSQAVGWTDASGNFWLFGGQGVDSTGNVGDLNDLWEFALSTHQWTWMGGSTTIPAAKTGQPGVYGNSGIPAVANIPGGRLGAVSWADSSGDLWMFGGNGYDSKDTYDSLDDLWVYQTSPGTLPAATPVFDVASGTYNSQQAVTVSDTTPGAVIYYTTDGTSPTTGSNAYSGPIAVSSSEALKAIAVVSQYGPSAVAIANYTITAPIGIGISTASANLLTVQSGGTGTFSFVVSPVGGATFPAAISFKATGLPAGAIATFAPATIAAGAGVSNVTLSIQISNSTAALHRSAPDWGLALCLLFLPLAGLGSWRKLVRQLNEHQKLLLWSVVIAGSVLALSGCGATKLAQIQSLSSSTSSAPYVVTITATSGQLQQTTTLNLAVQ